MKQVTRMGMSEFPWEYFVHTEMHNLLIVLPVKGHSICML